MPNVGSTAGLAIKNEGQEDNRGFYLNVWNVKSLSGFDWKEADISYTFHGALRGIHVSKETNKLCSCVYGVMFVVVVDPSTKHYTEYLLEHGDFSLLIPKGFGVGITPLSHPGATWFYLQDRLYNDADDQYVIRWNDPAYDITWPLENPILSERDK